MPDPTAQSESEEQRPPLLVRLQDLAEHITPSETPHANDPRVLAALIKVLDHDGTTVADELFPEPDQPDPAAQRAAAAAGPAELGVLTDLIRRAEAAVNRLEGRAPDSAGTEAAADETAAGAGTSAPSAAPAVSSTPPASEEYPAP